MILTKKATRRMAQLLDRAKTINDIEVLPFRLLTSSVMSEQQYTHLKEAGLNGTAIAESIVKSIRLKNQVELDDDELRVLLKYILNYEKGRKEVDDISAVLLFKDNCKHPAKSDLIYYPPPEFGTDRPTVDQVFQAARYGVIQRADRNVKN